MKTMPDHHVQSSAVKAARIALPDVFKPWRLVCFSIRGAVQVERDSEGQNAEAVAARPHFRYQRPLILPAKRGAGSKVRHGILLKYILSKGGISSMFLDESASVVFHSAWRRGGERKRGTQAHKLSHQIPA